MASLRVAAFVGAALLGSSMMIGQASAMPVDGLALATKQVANSVQDVRWVCGPYRCWWRPGPYYGYYPRPYWGWRGPYWGWRRCGWGRCWW
jgi:hypothetical protein